MTHDDTAFDLIRHMEWADALIWKTVAASPAASANEAIRGRLLHLHQTQHAFLHVWHGTVGEMLTLNPSDELTSLGCWAQSFYENVMSDRSKLDEKSLRGPVPGVLLKRAEERLGSGSTIPSIGDTVLQVVLHSTYHRGQINMKLREIGCEPPLTEYFVWVWRGRPAPEWPFESAVH